MKGETLNGLANLKPIRDSETARELQKKSSAKQKANTKERKLIRAVIEERLKQGDLDIIVDNLIERAKQSGNDFEIFQNAIGQKPADKVQITAPDSEVITEIDNYVK